MGPNPSQTDGNTVQNNNQNNSGQVWSTLFLLDIIFWFISHWLRCSFIVAKSYYHKFTHTTDMTQHKLLFPLSFVKYRLQSSENCLK
jgi:hypothetical protein